jgi:predicted kinase
MLRAGFHNGTDAGIIAGLTEENVMRLKDGKPIAAPLQSFGINLEGRLVILYGKTYQDLEAVLERVGVVGEDTKRSCDPRLDQEATARAEYQKILICTVGLPRSGKTTWARSQSYPVVNPDSIRLVLHGQRFHGPAEPWVWAMARTMVRSLFLSGHDTVILDATNLTRKRRDEWQSKEWGTFFKIIKATPAECMERAGDDAEIVPVINRMMAEYQPVEADEKVW